MNWAPFFSRFRQQRFLRILFLKTLGNFMIISSVLLTTKTFYEPFRSEARYFIDNALWGKQYIVSDKKDPNPKPTYATKGLARLFKIQQTEVLTPVDTDSGILIPKIAANAKVMTQVDASNEEEYLDVLKRGVAHVAGTGLAGDGRHIYLFAHSTDYIWNISTYNALFYLLYKLEPGDEVNLYRNGTRHIYEVIGSKVVNPDEIYYITRQTDEEELTLQTCWPPGTTLQRLLVFAKPKR